MSPYTIEEAEVLNRQLLSTCEADGRGRLIIPEDVRSQLQYEQEVTCLYGTNILFNELVSMQTAASIDI